MIREASEHFGTRLLSEEEKQEIFDNILSGPSRENYRERNGSLLESFYDRTRDDRTRWAILFGYIGRSLRSSDRDLNDELTDRIVDFFDWRLELAEPMELNEFAFWLEAECLDPEWRLKSYLKTLDFGQRKPTGISLASEILNRLSSGSHGIGHRMLCKNHRLHKPGHPVSYSSR